MRLNHGDDACSVIVMVGTYFSISCCMVFLKRDQFVSTEREWNSSRNTEQKLISSSLIAS